MIDVDKVVQAFSVQVYTQTLDLVQQLHPLKADDLDAHENRVNQIIAGVSDFLRGLSEDDLQRIDKNRNVSLKLDLSGTTVADISDGVQLILEKRIRSALNMCVISRLDQVQFIHATGEYLHNPSDHKRAWLSERAANLLIAGVSDV